MSNFGEDLPTCINILKGCIGGGIYSYPMLFEHYGVGLTAVMTILSGIASIFGAFIYLDLNEELKRKHSISSLACKIFSLRFKYFVDVVVILKCLVVAMGYLNLSKTMIRTVLSNSEHPYFKSPFMDLPSLFAAVGCLIQAPSILAARIDNLRYFSYIGTFSIIFIIIASMCVNNGNPVTFSVFTGDYNVMKEIGSFVFCFSCHQGILSIHNESSFLLMRLKLIMIVGFVGAGILYLLFGFINYSKLAGLGSMDDVFSLWDNQNLKMISALLFSFSLILSVPFQVHPAKTYLSDIFNLKNNSRKAVGVIMMLLCYFSTLTSFYSFKFASNVISKPLNILLCFLFPAIFQICNRTEKSTAEIVMIWYLILFSILCILSFFF